MTVFSPEAATDDIDPPPRMAGVTFSQLALKQRFLLTAPIADEWRLYVVRGDGAVLHAKTGIGTRILGTGTVIGLSGDTPHSFTSVPCDSNDHAAAEWIEKPLGTKIEANESLLAISRIPQSSMPFLALLGSFICIDPAQHREFAARVAMLIDWIADETIRNEPATRDIILRLAEIILIEIWRIGRAHSVLFDDRPDGAAYDPRIWRALAAVCSEPQRHWTVETMAAVAGMSRSAFAVRYHETTGQTPMRSLRRLRMHRAATALAASGPPKAIAPLADALGYGSDAAFNRAFAKEFGHPPKRYGLNNLSLADDRSKA